MAIFLTGDTHGDFSRFRPDIFYEQTGLTKDDCAIICGDFGGIWNGDADERHWLDWLEAKPFTTLFVSGNHENFGMLTDFLEEVSQRCRFKYHFFGHYHTNRVIREKYVLLYEQIIRLKE